MSYINKHCIHWHENYGSPSKPRGKLNNLPLGQNYFWAKTLLMGFCSQINVQKRKDSTFLSVGEKALSRVLSLFSYTENKRLSGFCSAIQKTDLSLVLHFEIDTEIDWTWIMRKGEDFPQNCWNSSTFQSLDTYYFTFFPLAPLINKAFLSYFAALELYYQNTDVTKSDLISRDVMGIPLEFRDRTLTSTAETALSFLAILEPFKFQFGMRKREQLVCVSVKINCILWSRVVP